MFLNLDLQLFMLSSEKEGFDFYFLNIEEQAHIILNTTYSSDGLRIPEI